MKLYRYFLDGIPDYLARYYWWAYLWRPAAWFFDHQVIINAILFGQYKTLMATTLRQLGAPSGRTLQLTCVYGALTPSILSKISPRTLHITDAAPVQLERLSGKVAGDAPLLATRMNAEQLGYKSNIFSTIVLFFLMHEMPPEARRRTLSETMRVLSVGGALLYTEYGPLPSNHLLYRFPLTRLILTKLEPFLASHWEDDITTLLRDLGKPYGKSVEIVSHTLVFFGFYRVTEFRIVGAD